MLLLFVFLKREERKKRKEEGEREEIASERVSQSQSQTVPVYCLLLKCPQGAGQWQADAANQKTNQGVSRVNGRDSTT